jgi:hypothetical protein
MVSDLFNIIDVSGMNTLEEFLKSKKASEDDYPHLPLVHTSKFNRCKSIAESSSFNKRECDVYEGEELLYFFYGKSRYNVNKKNLDNIVIIDEMPVTFLFVFKDVLKEVKIKRYLPFDSGGFDRYGLTDKEHFTISDPIGCRIEALVNLIYGDVHSYLNDIICKANLIDESTKSNAVKQLQKFYNETIFNGEIGKQALAIEIQITDNVTESPQVIFIPYWEATTNEFGDVVQQMRNTFKARIVPYLGPLIQVFCGFDVISPMQQAVKNEALNYVK